MGADDCQINTRNAMVTFEALRGSIPKIWRIVDYCLIGSEVLINKK
jgi:hypothetical protein